MSTIKIISTNHKFYTTNLNSIKSQQFERAYLAVSLLIHLPLVVAIAQLETFGLPLILPIFCRFHAGN